MSLQVDKLRPGDVALIGLCHDDNFSRMQGPEQEAFAIKAVRHGSATDLGAEIGIGLTGHHGLVDQGFQCPAWKYRAGAQNV